MNEPTEDNWRLEHTEEKCKEAERNAVRVREFVKTYLGYLSSHDNWSAYVWDGSLSFFVTEEHTAKDIATVFGPDGWTRKHNTSACGTIDWYKQLGDLTLVISAAETIKPKLIEEVKLT